MILTVAAIVAQASAVPAPGATPLENAKAWFAALQQGKLADPSGLNAQMTDALTPETLAQIASLLKDTGTPTSFQQVQTSAVQSLTIYVFKITFAHAPALDFIYTLDASGKIAGLRLSPAQ
ncbi:MAG: hypothetical protein JO322_02390 [Candidatus Eremiobacteraeota bacterium]|nr:hypothetical protein [Candidatus Eremiobacteraeota bacterium]